MGYDAALVSIDLGPLYLETGEVERLRRLASELMPIFAAKDLSKEAFACLLLYQDACQTLELTGQLGRELLRFLAEDRRRPPALRVGFRPGDDAEGPGYYDFVTLEWARQWPAEEIWVARKR